MVPLKEQRMPSILNDAFIRLSWCRSSPFPEYIYLARMLVRVTEELLSEYSLRVSSKGVTLVDRQQKMS
jgi:hypothetical protein